MGGSERLTEFRKYVCLMRSPQSLWVLFETAQHLPKICTRCGCATAIRAVMIIKCNCVYMITARNKKKHNHTQISFKVARTFTAQYVDHFSRQSLCTNVIFECVFPHVSEVDQSRIGVGEWHITIEIQTIL